jgi:TRAP transporter TAXI family solute receptor
MKILIVTAVLFNLLFGVGFATGSKSGTYYPIAKDIIDVCGLNMEAYETKGSLENYKRLLKDPKIKFAIMQYDVLQYFKRLKNRNVNKIKMVIPFYDEEIHIIVRKDSYFTSLQDLEDKVVAIGKRGSGTWLTSKLIQNATSIKFFEREIGTKDGLKKLMNNEIDALIIIAGVPTKLLSALPTKANKYFKLLNVYDPILNSIYKQTNIPAYKYKWQENSINTYSIKSILATFDYKPNQPSYKRVQKLYACLKEKLPYLKQYKHPKWSEINIDSFLDVKWPVHSAILNYSNTTNYKTKSAPPSNNSLKDEIEDILNDY